MLHHLATLVLAVDEHEPDKLPFYIGGAAFAVWAVVLGFFGLRSDSFPGGLTAERGVIGVSLLLMAVAVAMALITS
jgi:hypothetical protein